MPETTAPFTDQELTNLRSLFPHTEQDKIYFNHAAIGPLSTAVTNAIDKRLQDRGSGRIDTFDRDAATAEMVRRYLSRLINAPSEDRIAFVSNTSGGLNLVASGLKWSEGDHILINDMEFPANVYPYKNLEKQGVEVEQLSCPEGRITAEQIAGALRPSTCLVAVSAVQFLNGYRSDLKAIGEICRQNDCWFVVDAIQALGAVPLDVQRAHIDALVAGSHKWLMAPQGIATLYVSENLQQAIKRHYVGWLSVREPWKLFDTDQQLDPTARRFELGTPNFSGLIGLRASLEMLFETGPQKAARQIRRLTDHLIETFREWDDVSLLTPVQWEERAGIVTINLPDHIDNQKFIQSLKDQNLYIALRENNLRLAPHYYNTMEEIDRAVKLIRSTLAG